MRRLPRLAMTWAPVAVMAGLAGWSGSRSERAAAAAPPPAALLRTETFDRDPGWDGHNNRSNVPLPRMVRQDFGYSGTSHAGGGAGEIGGFVTPAAEPAYYAKVIPACGFRDRLIASGTLTVAPGGNLDNGAGNTLVGFFNAGTINEWRTPNTIALRINGRGSGFHAHLEYCTQRWRAGGDFFAEKQLVNGKKAIRLVPGGPTIHTWSLKYDPEGSSGAGTITATLDGETLAINLESGHKADGAIFNRFGLLNVMKSADGGGSIWLDDVSINGAAERFDRDPGWEGFHNRHVYATDNVRPRFNFGYSATHFAGGKAAGECGGLIFRGDERYPERMAYYGDRLETLTLNRPLKAAGRICLRRGVTDSTVLVGFFHATDSMRISQAQVSGIPENFLGAAIEGPSREGFLFYPLYGVDREGLGVASRFQPLPPHILPDGKPHDWSLEYLPLGMAEGRITATLDGQATRLDLKSGHREIGARFNRFGFVTTHIDGNAETVYLDDLTYTCRQDAG
jgi:hypothetical protein